MWVSEELSIKAFFSFPIFTSKPFYVHSFTHRFNSLNSPLTWVYTVFPQFSLLVTTTTYNYMKRPVRFPFLPFLNSQLLKIKTCKVIQVREG